MLVTSQNIAMVLDIAKYGVEENGVIFTLVTPPSHGTLALDLLNTKTDRTFTLEEVNQDKVNSFFNFEIDSNCSESTVFIISMILSNKAPILQFFRPSRTAVCYREFTLAVAFEPGIY